MLYEHSSVEHAEELANMSAEKGEEMNQKVLGILDQQELEAEAEQEKLQAEKEKKESVTIAKENSTVQSPSDVLLN